MTDAKPIPRVTHDDAFSALVALGNPLARGEAFKTLSAYITAQRIFSETRQADVATVREFLERYHSGSTVNVVDSLALTRALDRLAKE